MRLLHFPTIAVALKVRVVPYPIAGDTENFSQEVSTAGLQSLPPHAAPDKTIMTDAVSAALKDIMASEEEARRQFEAASQSAATAGAAGAGSSALSSSVTGSERLASVLGSTYATSIKIVKSFAGLAFLVGILDYNSPELVGTLTRLYLFYFIDTSISAAWFTIVTLNPTITQPSFVVWIVMAVSAALAYGLTLGMKHNSQKWVLSLGYCVITALVCGTMLKNVLTQAGPVVSPTLLVCVGALAGKYFVTPALGGRTLRSIMAAVVTTVGFVGAMGWAFDPFVLMSPVYPAATQYTALSVLIIVIVCSAYLQRLREGQRLKEFDLDASETEPLSAGV
eukprot:Blabericola_migrator_1__4169@NODE_2275_length_3018_cov_68_038292_g678_i1_p2_GENE_NODE_2275_length_3018_cov_68_038292_g678_i1NODE_2275_length_3018_cov_68_038292_g678_i1_p2_ORF_typecomplete_len337_score62_48MlaA/PF04333_13/0_025UPF0184/PF03670_13/0_22_NODE_2275_length_3018_cov_68_038292_g678_i113562366